MKMQKRILVHLLLIVTLLSSLLGACTDIPGDGNTVTGGKLILQLTDAPINANTISGVYIKINKIDVNKDGEWTTINDFQGPKIFNLMDLTSGKFALLGEFELTAGKYNQIRFILDIQEQSGNSQANPGCYVKFTDDSTKPLFVPSGGQTGYKAVGEFEVPVNGDVKVTVDFDVRKALHVTGQVNNQKYILKPTLRLIVDSQAGSISGMVTNKSTYSDIVIYAYANNSWNATEANDPQAEQSRFPNAVTSVKAAQDGSYKLAFLAQGTYDLVITGYTTDTYQKILGYIADVVVQSNQTKNVNIDTNTLAPAL